MALLFSLNRKGRRNLSRVFFPCFEPMFVTQHWDLQKKCPMPPSTSPSGWSSHHLCQQKTVNEVKHKRRKQCTHNKGQDSSRPSATCRSSVNWDHDLSKPHFQHSHRQSHRGCRDNCLERKGALQLTTATLWLLAIRGLLKTCVYYTYKCIYIYIYRYIVNKFTLVRGAVLFGCSDWVRLAKGKCHATAAKTTFPFYACGLGSWAKIGVQYAKLYTCTNDDMIQHTTVQFTLAPPCPKLF